MSQHILLQQEEEEEEEEDHLLETNVRSCMRVEEEMGRSLIMCVNGYLLVPIT
jgi:hypothetical protein